MVLKLAIQISFFKMKTPIFTVNYLVENCDVPNSKYERVVAQLLKCLY